LQLARLAYYARSLATLAASVANPFQVARALLRPPSPGSPATLLRLRSGDAFAVRRALDVWVIKEVLLDGEYARIGPPIGRGWTVVDIGAAHGAFALTAARAGASRVIAVEPSPDTFALLGENLRRNGAARVETYRTAVGATDGTASLALSPRGGVENSTAARAPGLPRIDVPMTRLASLFETAKIRRCDYLKLDCEGGEFDALLAASDATLARVERICLEYHDDVCAHSSPELVARLERAGFTVRREPSPVTRARGWLLGVRNAADLPGSSPPADAGGTSAPQSPPQPTR
jgi:FkbM family methyltransferase